MPSVTIVMVARRRLYAFIVAYVISMPLYLVLLQFVTPKNVYGDAVAFLWHVLILLSLCLFYIPLARSMEEERDRENNYSRGPLVVSERNIEYNSPRMAERDRTTLDMEEVISVLPLLKVLCIKVGQACQMIGVLMSVIVIR